MTISKNSITKKHENTLTVFIIVPIFFRVVPLYCYCFVMAEESCTVYRYCFENSNSTKKKQYRKQKQYWW